MRRHERWRYLLAWGGVALALGAAPAAPSYSNVDQTIREIRESWALPGAVPQRNAPGWNAFFEALKAEFDTYAGAADDQARLVALNRLYQMSGALAYVGWTPAQRLREELRGWLRPRIRLAWADRQMHDSLHGLGLTNDPNVLENRERWVHFVDDSLGAALRRYESAKTVQERLGALRQIYGALHALQASNQTRPWVPSITLQSALNDLCNVPNLDISADTATVAPFLSRDIVQSGPVSRKGYVTHVTAGPKTGFGLLPSDDGIAFYNSQISTSVTPITDFQQQVQQDRKGRRAAKLYQFSATSQDTSQITITAVLRSSGLQVGPAFQHNIDAAITSMKQPGKALGRFFAGLLGFNQPKITQQVYDGAIDKIRRNVVQEAAQVGREKADQAVAEQNAKLAQVFLGNNTLSVRNLLITGLSLRSRPENALLGGTLRWRGAREQVGADAPQPARLAVPDPGVSADLHLNSIMTSLVRGYLQSDAAQRVSNLMLVTRKVEPNTPPGKGIVLSQNVDYPTFLKAVKESRAANDPKVMAIRVKRPGDAPEFAADARGFLVAVVHDFLVEVPAPAQAAGGGLFSGPPAQVYRFTAPHAEFVISFKVEPETRNNPIRLSGRIENFEAGPGAKVYAVREDESKASSLPVFTSNLVLGVFSAKIKGQPIDLPLSDLKLQGFAIRSVSPLDPTGWMRVSLVRTSDSPAAGIQ